MQGFTGFLSGYVEVHRDNTESGGSNGNDMATGLLK